jgi:hypothetical protein
MINDKDNWSKWENHVLTELKRQNEFAEKTMDVVTKISIELAGLKVKSGVWGLIGGTIPVIVALAFLIIKG